MRSAELPQYHRGRLPIGAKKIFGLCRSWPEATDPGCPLFRRYQSESRRDADIAKRVFLTDFVEEVGEQFEIKRSGHSNALDGEPLMVSGWVRAWHRYQLCQLSEVLGGCCEKELIARAIRSSESEPIEAEDAFW